VAVQAFGQRGSQWIAWKECIISDGVIYPSGKGPIITSNSLEKYEIFDYYSMGPDSTYSPISEKILSYVLNDTKKGIQDICLHHLFATVDPSDWEQIRRFVEYFGPLYLPPKYSKGELGDALNVDPKLLPPIRLIGPGFPVSSFIEEQQRFKELIDMIQIYQNASVIGLTNSQLKELENAIESRFMPYTSLVTPYLRFDRSEDGSTGKPIWSWHVGSLLNALYFMLFMDFTTKGIPLKCANPSCNQFFYPINSKKDTIYCSYTCYNRVNQRNHKARKAQVRALWQEGKSLQEISKYTGLELEKIKRWINTFKG